MRAIFGKSSAASGRGAYRPFNHPRIVSRLHTAAYVRSFGHTSIRRDGGHAARCDTPRVTPGAPVGSDFACQTMTSAASYGLLMSSPNTRKARVLPESLKAWLQWVTRLNVYPGMNSGRERQMPAFAYQRCRMPRTPSTCSSWSTEIDPAAVTYLVSMYPRDRVGVLADEQGREQIYVGALTHSVPRTPQAAKDRIAAIQGELGQSGTAYLVLPEEIVSRLQALPALRISARAFLRIPLPYPWGPA